MDATAAARAWVDAWERGWRAHEAETIAALYTDDAVYLSHPFREPLLGAAGAREYAQQAFADEEDAEIRFGEPVVGGGRAVVEYWAVIRDRLGTAWTLAGTSVLRFAPDGRVEDHRDYWTMDEGRRAPPAGWGH